VGQEASAACLLGEQGEAQGVGKQHGLSSTACQRVGMGIASACLLHVLSTHAVSGGEAAQAHRRRGPARPPAAPGLPGDRPCQSLR
jgi:hypothetical protein